MTKTTEEQITATLEHLDSAVAELKADRATNFVLSYALTDEKCKSHGAGRPVQLLLCIVGQLNKLIDLMDETRDCNCSVKVRAAAAILEAVADSGHFEPTEPQGNTEVHSDATH